MKRHRKPWPGRFWAKVDKTPGQGPNGDCWMWTASRDTCGYGQITDLTGRLCRATHIMWELTYGIRPSGKLLCHTCDNPPCVNPEHLFEDDHKANAADTEEQVREIRVIYKPANRGARHAAISQRILAKKYGVSRSVIQQIIDGNIWQHIVQSKS